MADQPEVTANEGTPEQLPRGAATEVNALMPTSTELAAPTQPAPLMFPSETEQTAGQPEFQPGADNTAEQILFGNPDPTEPTTPELPIGRLPDSVVRWLLVMKAAASEPNAPDSLRAIYTAAVHSLDSELRA